MSDLQSHLADWQQDLQGKPAEVIVEWAITTFGYAITFATSLGAEDQVLTDMIAKASRKLGKTMPIFTLDTGRLFQESYQLLEDMQAKYGLDIQIMFPQREAVETMVAKEGINLFRKSVELRRKCCGIRKIEPLKRALQSKDAWMVGLRRDQSVTRTDLSVVEWDEGNGMVKVSPLHDWSHEQIWDYIKAQNVPYNPLHDQGFLSIGCASCTRAVKPGEDIRAGRWWWEEPEKKECGLHFKDGKLVRANQS